MRVNLNWREMVNLINDPIGKGWNANQRLGMKFLGESLGPGDWAGAAHWQAGNCQIFVNSWRVENKSVVDLIRLDEPPDQEALKTWERLETLLSSAGLVDARQELPGHEDARATKNVRRDTTGWDETLIDMWKAGFLRADIAARVGRSKGRVTNRVTELRHRYGERTVPYRAERRRRPKKS